MTLCLYFDDIGSLVSSFNQCLLNCANFVLPFEQIMRQLSYVNCDDIMFVCLSYYRTRSS